MSGHAIAMAIVKVEEQGMPSMSTKSGRVQNVEHQENPPKLFIDHLELFIIRTATFIHSAKIQLLSLTRI